MMLLRSKTDKNAVCNQPLEGPKTSQPERLSAAGAQKWAMCKWDQLLQHTLHKCTVVLQFDKCTELQNFLLFCAAILRDKELLCPWLQISDLGAK